MPQRGEDVPAYAGLVEVARRGRDLQAELPPCDVLPQGCRGFDWREMCAAADLDLCLGQGAERCSLRREPLPDHPALDSIGDLPRRSSAMSDAARVGHRTPPQTRHRRDTDVREASTMALTCATTGLVRRMKVARLIGRLVRRLPACDIGVTSKDDLGARRVHAVPALRDTPHNNSRREEDQRHEDLWAGAAVDGA